MANGTVVEFAEVASETVGELVGVLSGTIGELAGLVSGTVASSRTVRIACRSPGVSCEPPSMGRNPAGRRA